MTEFKPLAGQDILSALRDTDVRSADDTVYILDPEHKYAFVVSNACPKGESPLSMTQDDLHRKYHEAAFAGEKTIYQWHARVGGKEHYYNSILIPLLDAKKAVIYVLGIIKDITAIANSLAVGGGVSAVRDSLAQSFAQTLLAIREEERKTAASAIHDELGTTAVMLNSMVALIEEDLKENKTKDALKNVRELDEKVKISLEKLKNVAVNMRPPNLDAVGLEGAVEELVRGARANAKGAEINFDYKDASEGTVMSDTVKITLYRVVQECLNNILQHANATKIDIKMENSEKNVKVRITDNGKGFDVNAHRSIKNIGLLGMRERVKYLGGKFNIKSTLGKGTEVEAVCPKVVYTVERL